MGLSSSTLRTYVDSVWQEKIVPTLTEYIRIPNKSPMFDPEWRARGHMAKAVSLVETWLKANAPKDAKVEVMSDGDRTPLVVVDIPGQVDDTVLLYGHLDKQPEMTGWTEGLGPWTPVLKDEKLYGRGGADDGYAAFASLTAINALREQKIPHPRCVIMIEACEESGSTDLPYYVDILAPRLGKPSLVVCLDAGCGNYEQMWMTTSLRGVITCNLHVSLLTEGVHSGDASGVVPDSFRVLKALISRLEDEATGEIIPKEFHVTIPDKRIAEAKKLAR